MGRWFRFLSMAYLHIIPRFYLYELLRMLCRIMGSTLMAGVRPFSVRAIWDGVRSMEVGTLGTRGRWSLGKHN